MNTNKLNNWIRYLFPVFLALFLGILIFLMAQFREPPGLEWYAFFWFTGSIFLIWESAWRISKSLEQRFSWRERTFRRLLYQLAITNLIGILIFLGSFVLLNWYENQVIGNDNPMGLIHIMVVIGEAFLIVQIINGVQISYQLLQTWQTVQLEAENYKKESVIARLEVLRQQIDPQFLDHHFSELEALLRDEPEKVGTFLEGLSQRYQNRQSQLVSSIAKVQLQLNAQSTETTPAQASAPAIPRTRFLVRSGARLIVVPIEDILAFYKDDLVLLYTREGKKYPVDHSLEELTAQLPPLHFFRINRQCIVHAAYLKEMRMENHQIQVSFATPFPKALIVSQRNVARFKRWLNGELP